MALVLFICVGGIVCLTPLSLYLRWVGTLNRSDQPAVVPGVWDFVALVAGLSGFLLFGGGVLVALLRSNARLLFRANVEQMESVASAEWFAWVATAAAYVLVLVGGVGLTLMSRSRALSVYNITRERAAAVVEGALSDLDISTTRAGDLWSQGTGLVEVQPFDSFRHVTFWLVSGDLRRRQDIERTLRSRLAAERAADNPIVPYVLVASTTIGCAAISFVLMIGYVVFDSIR